MSDCGLQFTSAFARELTRLLQYDIALSSAYHSQTDGEMECYNQELKTYLCIFCKGQLQKWLELLLMAEFAHTTAVYLVTGKSPFPLMMGCKLQSYPPLERPFFQLLSSDSTKLRMYGRKLKLHTNWQNNEWRNKSSHASNPRKLETKPGSKQGISNSKYPPGNSQQNKLAPLKSSKSYPP